MSSLSDFSSLTSKSPENPSSFSQTCARWSQYIKEKGNIGDLNIGISCTTETNGSFEMYQQRSTTMNLFPMEDKLDNTFNLNSIAAKAQQRKNVTSLNLFPQETALSSFVAEEDLSKMVQTHSSTAVNKSASEEHKRAQMTIFYGGQVFVFDDFPAEKAKDVMSFAGKRDSRNHSTFAPSLTQNVQSIISRTACTPFSSNINVTPSTNNNLIQELNKQQSNRTVICDLPISRKVSLRRFLEKRKDRIASRAPYHISSFVSGPSKSAAAEGMPWLQLAAPTSH